jgi:hypothetical protein
MTRLRRHARTGALIALLLALPTVAGPGPATESPREIIERAIKSHGGRERLARLRADRVKLVGKIKFGVERVPFVGETTVQPPGQFRTVLEVTAGGKSHKVVRLLDGDRTVLTLDGVEQPVAAAQREELRHTLQLNRAMRLVPLLEDRAFTLAPLDEIQVNGRKAVGVRVTTGGRELRLYFDKEHALLVKTEHLLDGAGGKKVRHESYYGAYADVEGYKRPGKVVAFRDGVPVMEATLAEVSQFESLSPEVFRRP